MVVVAGAGKRQQLVTVGDSDRADIQLLIEYLRHLHAVLFVKPLAQDPLSGGGNLERRRRKRGGIFFKHGALVEQDTHKQRGTHGVGDHHRRGNAINQMQRILKRAGNQQNNQHLYQLRDKGHGPGRQRTEDAIRPSPLDQHAVDQATQ